MILGRVSGCKALMRLSQCEFGRHYLSNATCLIRPRALYALFVVSRITVICKSVRRF